LYYYRFVTKKQIIIRSDTVQYIFYNDIGPTHYKFSIIPSNDHNSYDILMYCKAKSDSDHDENSMCHKCKNCPINDNKWHKVVSLPSHIYDKDDQSLIDSEFGIDVKYFKLRDFIKEQMPHEIVIIEPNFTDNDE
jgi:hypothetical protein